MTNNVEPAGATSPRSANALDMHVGSRVRLRRLLLNMSQEKLGEKLGLTFQQVQKYEKGSNRIGASRLYELARVLSVSIEYFFQDAPAPHVALTTTPGFAEVTAESYMADFLSSREGIDLNRAFQRIADPKVRRSLIDLCRTLAGDEVVGPANGDQR